MTRREVEAILLVGMMGAGKTTVGVALARRLGWSFLDSDAEVEAATGMTVPEIFAAQGEAAFRAQESAVLAAACARPVPGVVAVAGGAVLDAANRAMIKRARLVVWLRAEVASLADRVGDGSGRPLLGANPAAALARLEQVRRPLYQEVADMVIDVDGLPVERVVGSILEEWESRLPARPLPGEPRRAQVAPVVRP